MLVSLLHLLDVTLHLSKPLPGDPEGGHGEDEGEDQHGEAGTVHPGGAPGPRLPPLLVLQVGGGFDHGLLLVHCPRVGRDAAVRRRERGLLFLVPAGLVRLVRVREKLTS